MCPASKYVNQLFVLPRSILIIIIRWLFSLSILSLLAMPLLLHASELSSVALTQSGPSEAEILDPASAQQNQLILGLQPWLMEDELQEFLEQKGLKLIKQWPDLNSILVEIEASPAVEISVNAAQRNSDQAATRQAFALLEETRHELEQLSTLRYVAYNRRIYAADLALGKSFGNNALLPNLAESIQPANAAPIDASAKGISDPLPNDPEFSKQWALPMSQVVESWNISQGDPDVVIAVIDSGYDLSHPDLTQDALWQNSAEVSGVAGVDDDGNGYIDDLFAWDWVDNDNDFSNDTYGHGTHVGGTIAAVTNNSIGISGVGQNLKIMPLRILDGQGAGYIDSLVDALDYANRKQVRIINLSLVLEFDSPILSEAIDKYAQDTLIISATGNEGSHVFWPAEYEGTVAVGATDNLDRYSPISNFGPRVDMAGPGIDILGAGRDRMYVNNSGTSMATSFVSALAGLVRSLRPDYSSAQILEAITQSAVDINQDEYPGRDDFIGHGRIDFYQTLMNASVGLQVVSDDSTDAYIVPGYPISSRVEVSTPATDSTQSIPVRGAVVRYEFILDNEVGDNEPVVSGQVLTNEDGVAFITFFAPSVNGTYLFRRSVGQEVIEQSVTIYPEPSTVDIVVATPFIAAGDGVALVSVEARDENGDLILIPQSLRLETNYGTFADGQQSVDLIMSNGLYTTTFYAETTKGTATIRADLADILTDSQEIEVIANQPVSIELISDTPAINTASGEATTTILVLLYDAYGNSLDRFVPVELYTSMGQISAPVAQSANPNGMSSALIVSAGSSGSAVIWAAVPSRQLLTKLTIDISNSENTNTLLPFVIRP